MRTRRGTGIDQGLVWDRPAQPGLATAIIVYVSGTITMIAAGVFLILMGPQG